MRDGTLLDVESLTVRYAYGSRGEITALDAIALSVRSAEIVGVEGESGSGKTTLALAVMGLLPRGTRVDGSLRFRGRDLGGLPPRALRALRGHHIAIVFQEPVIALNPVMTVGRQIVEVVRAHVDCDRREARVRAQDAIADVGLGPALPRVFDAYPHELSHGQAQRIAIAQALVCRPGLIVADEPSASVDAITRRALLDLIGELRRRHETAFLLISHDAATLSATADRIVTLSRGRVARTIVPRPFTVNALNVPEAPRGDDAAPPVVAARGVTKMYRPRRLFGHAPVRGVAGVDFDVAAGSTLGLAGASGAGKSTLARCLAGLETMDAGEIRIAGDDIARRGVCELRGRRQQVQLVFQDSAAALNPRFTAEAAVAEPLVIRRIGSAAERRARARALMTEVGLPVGRASARVHEFSGGQRQRLAIARALAAEPRALVLDEAFSGIDPADRARIVGLLRRLQRRYGLAYVCISHDLELLAAFAPELAVMHEGRIVERGPTRQLIGAPQHPITRALVAAAFARADVAGVLAG